MENKVVFVDMDGTIIAPIFKTDDGTVLGFPTDKWIAFCNSCREHSYDHCVPVTQVLDRIKRLVANGYDAKILTVALSEGERIAKKAWVGNNEEYSYMFSEIIFLDKIEDKIPYIKGYIGATHIKPENTLIIDDHYNTLLTAISEGISVLHISHIIAPN